MQVRYGINPHQSARVPDTGGAPLRVLAGEPSYINLLDALNGWPLVHEAALVTGKVTAASFKHVSPAGAATAGPLDAPTLAAFGYSEQPGPATTAYLRARDADPKSSYGDLVAVSSPVDAELADTLSCLVCDGIVAPGFEPGTVASLARKKSGRFLVLEADPSYCPPQWERREVYGMTLEQEVDRARITEDLLPAAAGGLPPARIADALLGMVIARYTQSNSVAFVRAGTSIGIGAGQQSRIDCTRLCAAKSRLWWLRRHPNMLAATFRDEVTPVDRLNWVIRILEGALTPSERVRLARSMPDGVDPPTLTDAERGSWLSQLAQVTMVSDGFITFRDNVECAAANGVDVLVEPGGSTRSADVTGACDELAVLHLQTGLRLFHH